MLLADELLRALQRAATAVYMSMMYYVLCVRIREHMGVHVMFVCTSRARMPCQNRHNCFFSLREERELSVHFALFSTKLDEPKSCGDNDATCFVQQEK